MSIQQAITNLKAKYNNESWYNSIGIPQDKNIIILYVNCDPANLSLPATWEKIPLYIVKFNKKHCLTY